MNKNIRKKTSTIILDCTLRDGGYYNNWDFESNVVERYLKSMQAASVDVIDGALVEAGSRTVAVVGIDKTIEKAEKLSKDSN